METNLDGRREQEEGGGGGDGGRWRGDAVSRVLCAQRKARCLYCAWFSLADAGSTGTVLVGPTRRLASPKISWAVQQAQKSHGYEHFFNWLRPALEHRKISSSVCFVCCKISVQYEFQN